mgnify:CR=1 FL=1
MLFLLWLFSITRAPVVISVAEFNVAPSADGDTVTGNVSPGCVGVAQVSCGSKHSLVLLRDGRVLSCGAAARGSLGHGDVKEARGLKVVTGTLTSDTCGIKFTLAKYQNVPLHDYSSQVQACLSGGCWGQLFAGGVR